MKIKIQKLSICCTLIIKALNNKALIWLKYYLYKLSADENKMNEIQYGIKKIIKINKTL